MTSYQKQVYGEPSPQSEAIRGRENEMTPNNAGGYVFPVDDFTRLRRFLVLGSEGGNYYTNERKLILENAAAVKPCIETDGKRTIDEILDASLGNAPKNDPSLFALAMAASFGDEATRRRAFEVLPQVARTGTHLFHFAEFADSMRGWVKGLRKSISRWYEAQEGVEAAAYQVVKYRQRQGWSHRDLLRKTHPEGKLNPELGAIYAWVTQGALPPEDDDRYRIIRAYEYVQQHSDQPQIIADAMREQKMTWEMIPSTAMNEKVVWEALFETMPVTAMIRNLANLTRHGIVAPMSDAAALVARRVQDPTQMRRARVHPIAVLSALLTYKSGHGLRGSNTWDPVPQVVDALDAVFDKSFAQAPQTGQRFYLGIDVSGSMSGGCVAGVPGLTPRMGAAAMAMAIARREQNYYISAFANGATSSSLPPSQERDMMKLDITASDSIVDTMRKTHNLPWGGTDCALPMLDAMRKNMPVDCFVILTDSETWAGKIHPPEALRQYRQKMNIPARLVVIAMTSNGFSIADPNDAGMLDVVGFDASVPAILADFVHPAENPHREQKEVLGS